jgi:cell division ATPase FtsA
VLFIVKACGIIKIADTNIENNQRVKYMSVGSNHPKTREEKLRNIITLNMNEILGSVQNYYRAVNSQCDRSLKN